MRSPAAAGALALLLSLAAHAGDPHPGAGAQGSDAAGAEQVEYAGRSYGGLAQHLATSLEEFRQDFGGATFGVDGTREPVLFEGGVEEAVMEMIRTSPEVARKVRAEGGQLTAVFEFRPRLQPADANIYLRVFYSDLDGHFELRRIVDPADTPVREDATGLHVEVP